MPMWTTSYEGPFTPKGMNPKVLFIPYLSLIMWTWRWLLHLAQLSPATTAWPLQAPHQHYGASLWHWLLPLSHERSVLHLLLLRDVVGWRALLLGVRFAAHNVVLLLTSIMLHYCLLVLLLWQAFLKRTKLEMAIVLYYDWMEFFSTSATTTEMIVCLFLVLHWVAMSSSFLHWCWVAPSLCDLSPCFVKALLLW